MQEKSNGIIIIIIGNKLIKLSYGGPLSWDGGFSCHPCPLGFLGLRAAPRTFFFLRSSCSTTTTRKIVADLDSIFSQQFSLEEILQVFSSSLLFVGVAKLFFPLGLSVNFLWVLCCNLWFLLDLVISFARVFEHRSCKFFLFVLFFIKKFGVVGGAICQ